MKKDGIVIGKIPGGQRKVKADFKKIMEAVVKTGLMAATGNWFNAAKEFAGVISAVQLKKEPGQIAYYFILEALVNTAHHLMAENQWRLRRDIIDPENLIGSKEYVQFLDSITGVLDEEEIVFGPSFLHDPKSLEILPPFQQYFKETLLLFGTPANEAEQIANRLPAYFVFELNDSWRKNTNDYAELLKKLKTPFSPAVERELQWQAYQAFLDWQIDQPVFEEAFSLRDIFIPLRAYYEDKGKEATRFGHVEAEEKAGKRRVVWLEESLDKWLQYKKPQDEIKMMSGGPGSGKSSFAKMWAAKVAHEKKWQVIFIPLHLFDIHGNIIDALGKYLISTPSIPFTYNPLENPQPNEKFLVIFDGLDELVMQGKTARDSAADFIDALEKLCHRFNTGDTTLLKILIAGRPISVQNADSRLRGTKQQVIYLLPYFLTEEEIKKYEDTDKLLPTDQRQTWWHQYQKLKNLPGNNMPKELQNENLDNLTREPLLNYLISLSWSFAPEKFGKDTNINEIYYILMHGVYKRDYEGGRMNKNIGHLAEDQFFQILEEIAVCAWHGGDVRVTSERKIEKHIADRGLKPLLEEYKESVKGAFPVCSPPFTSVNTVGTKAANIRMKLLNSPIKVLGNTSRLGLWWNSSNRFMQLEKTTRKTKTIADPKVGLNKKHWPSGYGWQVRPCLMMI